MGERHLRERDLVLIADPHGAPSPQAAGHLGRCPSCRRRLDQYRCTLKLASSLPAPEWSRLQSETFWHRARRALPKRRAPAWRPALAWAGLVVLAAFAAFHGARSGGGAAPPTGAATVPTVSSTHDIAQAPGAREEPAEADGAGQEEVAELIDRYLIDTATTDELIQQLGRFEADDFAVLIE